MRKGSEGSKLETNLYKDFADLTKQKKSLYPEQKYNFYSQLFELFKDQNFLQDYKINYFNQNFIKERFDKEGKQTRVNKDGDEQTRVTQLFYIKDIEKFNGFIKELIKLVLTNPDKSEIVLADVFEAVQTFYDSFTTLLSFEPCLSPEFKEDKTRIFKDSIKNAFKKPLKFFEDDNLQKYDVFIKYISCSKDYFKSLSDEEDCTEIYDKLSLLKEKYSIIAKLYSKNSQELLNIFDDIFPFTSDVSPIPKLHTYEGYNSSGVINKSLFGGDTPDSSKGGNRVNSNGSFFNYPDVYADNSTVTDVCRVNVQREPKVKEFLNKNNKDKFDFLSGLLKNNNIPDYCFFVRLYNLDLLNFCGVDEEKVKSCFVENDGFVEMYLKEVQSANEQSNQR